MSARGVALGGVGGVVAILMTGACAQPQPPPTNEGLVLAPKGAPATATGASSGATSGPSAGPAGVHAAGPARAPHFDVRDFGAIPDGRTSATTAIASAITAAAAAGGGTVYFGPGEYLTGPIRLRSHITLFVDAGAVVKFSNAFDDYLPMVPVRWEGTEVRTFSPLISGDKLENVAIAGRGVLDGQGAPWWKTVRELKRELKAKGTVTESKWQKEFARLNAGVEQPDDPQALKIGFLRPPFIQLRDCHNVSIRDVTLRNSPFWTVNPAYCDDLTVIGVTIENPDDAPNTDGINPDSCRNVHISDCHISVGDDCITIKSGRDGQGRRINRPAENYVITNCTMLRGHGGVVIGSEMSGGVRQIAISNSVFDGTDRGIRIKSTRGRGGVVENIQVSNVVMRDIREEAITLNMFYSDVPAEPVSERTPRFRNIHIHGVSGNAKTAGLLLGLPEAPLEDVSLSEIDLRAQAGLSIKDARGVSLRGVRIDAAQGPAIAVERSSVIELGGVGTRTPLAATPVVSLSDVQDAFVHGSFAVPGTDVFLGVAGAKTRAVMVDGNDWTVAKKALTVAKDVPRGGVTGKGAVPGKGAVQ